MVDAEVERRDCDAHKEEDDHGGVKGQVARETALETKVVDLAAGDAEDEENDEENGELGDRLVLEIVGREAGDGDPVEGVVV